MRGLRGKLVFWRLHLTPKRKFAFLDPVWFLTVDGKAKDSCPKRPR
jgi:hypothetical protein